MILLTFGALSASPLAKAAVEGTPSAEVLEKALAESMSLFESGADEEAERKLAEINARRETDGAGHLKIAINLLRVAFAYKENGEAENAQKVAQKILLRLLQAEAAFPKDSEHLSNISKLRGIVQEKLLGDSSAAAKEYLRATTLKRSPVSDQVGLER